MERVEHLKFASDILIRLGEELISDPDQGIVELVRNAYDADAARCQVILEKVDSPGGSIQIVDDGDGMTVNSINSGWLVVGRSSKSTNRVTPKGRISVGDKGLGRLAALRLGRKALLKTRPRSEPGVEYEVEIDWSAFTADSVVEQVPIRISSKTTRRSPGTDISIEGLRSTFKREQIEALAKSILLLSDPFDHDSGFRATLKAPGHPDLESKVTGAYFDDAEYTLEAELNEFGKASAIVRDWTGKQIWKAGHLDIAGTDVRYRCPPAKFQLWVFNLGTDKFARKKAPSKGLRDWLKTFGSIHLYHKGLRVRPYGDPGHDWLELNLARVRSPELRPSTNNSLGRVFVEDSESLLLQKTDRMGFVEDENFKELKNFAVDSAEWLAKKRLELRESQRKEKKETAREKSKKARVSLEETLVNAISKKDMPTVKGAISKYFQAIEKERETLREDLQLYRTLATAGTTAAVFAHESGKPISTLSAVSKTIESRGKKALGEKYAEVFLKPIELMNRSLASLSSFASMPLHFLKRDKRKSGVLDVSTALRDTVEFFHPFLSAAKIEVQLELPANQSPMVYGSSALLEAIVANLITNAVNAFNANTEPKERLLVFRVSCTGDFVLLKALDTGPGIRTLTVDEVWLPGRTSHPGGTGLGLTIVRDSVEEMSGSVHAVAMGELGGAEFLIKLPLAKDLE